MPFQPIPDPVDKIATASGCYQGEHGAELRLDVDCGQRYPQMAASGNFLADSMTGNIHWIVTGLKMKGDKSWWTGDISYLWDGSSGYQGGDLQGFLYSGIDIWLHTDNGEQYAYVAFSDGRGVRKDPIRLQFRGRHYRELHLVLALVENAKKVIGIDPCARNDGSANLICENLTIEDVFGGAGFKVTSESLSKDLIALSGAGDDGLWSVSELYDVLINFLEQSSDLHPWSIYTLFAGRHSDNYLGVMFDYLGTDNQHNGRNMQRQGCAVFTVRANTRARDDRDIFFATCHEIGHSLNLPHSWEPLAPEMNWIMSDEEGGAHTFMNSGSDFRWANFEYRFSGLDDVDSRRGRDLLFLRHAPVEFVRPGSELNFVNDMRLDRLRSSGDQDMALELRANRPGDVPIFEFMEPVMLELKLSNNSSEPWSFDKYLLDSADSITVTISKDGQGIQVLKPYVRYCREPELIGLEGKPHQESGEKKERPLHTIYESLFVSVGITGRGGPHSESDEGRRTGWYIAEPGSYRVQVFLYVNGTTIISNVLAIKVERTMEVNIRQLERIAQDYFGSDVARILAMDGAGYTDPGSKVLEEVISFLPSHPAAIHAAIPLGLSSLRPYRRLQKRKGKLCMEIENPQPARAEKLLDTALFGHVEGAARSLGHIDYHRYVDNYSAWLNEGNKTLKARACQDKLLGAMRHIRHGRIPQWVLTDIERKRDSYGEMAD